MRKTVLIMLLVLALLTSAASAVGQVNTADALNELGLFFGTGESYDLDSGLTRAQGIALLVRMIGKETQAQVNAYNTPFTDVPDWAAGYVGYAYAHKITAGVSETEFDPDGSMTDYMFLTLTLRALGYSDTGSNPLFAWENPYGLAYSLGLVKSMEPKPEFLRGDAAEVFWNAFDVKLCGESRTLADRMMEQGIISEKTMAKARRIQANGLAENTQSPDETEQIMPVKPVQKPVPVPTPEPYPNPEPDPTPDPDPTPAPSPGNEPELEPDELPLG